MMPEVLRGDEGGEDVTQESVNRVFDESPRAQTEDKHHQKKRHHPNHNMIVHDHE